jgi:hypothetical protein
LRKIKEFSKMNVPDVKNAQATATFNRAILKEKFK